MFIGNLNTWMSDFAKDIVSVSENDFSARESVVSKHKQILLEDYMIGEYKSINNDDEKYNGIWSAPKFVEICSSVSEPLGRWESPSRVMKIDFCEESKDNLWCNPSIWGS